MSGFGFFLFGFFYVLSVFKLCYRILMFGTVFSFFFYRSPRCVAGFFYFVAVKDFILLPAFYFVTAIFIVSLPFSF